MPTLLKSREFIFVGLLFFSASDIAATAPGLAFDDRPALDEPVVYSLKWSIAYNLVTTLPMLPPYSEIAWKDIPIYAGDPTMGLDWCRYVCAVPGLRFELEWSQAALSDTIQPGRDGWINIAETEWAWSYDINGELRWR